MASNKSTGNKKKSSANKKAPAAKKPQRQQAPEPRKSVISPRVKSILYVAAALFFFVMIVFKGQSFWTMLRAAFIGVFGFGIILVPAAFIYLCVMNEKEKEYIAHYKAKVALCVLTVAAVLRRRHNDANVLCVSGEFLSIPALESLVRRWLTTPFDGGRHEPRVQKISDIERQTGL